MSDNELREQIQKAIDENEVILFMKGTPDEPRCGFSARAVAVLNAVGVGFTAVDVLPDPAIKQELAAVSDWPTTPQLFVKGELVGGSDIMIEMYESGELAELVVDGDGDEAVAAEGGTGEPGAGQPAPSGAPEQPSE